MPFRTPDHAVDWHNIPGFMHPELMVIGDSLANGMQSLTIDAARARNSVGAVVAGAMEVDYRVPEYPRPVLVDVEKMLRPRWLWQLATSVKRAVRGMQTNAISWVADLEQRGDGTRFFDGLGLAGAVCDDLINKTYGDWRADLVSMRATFADDKAWRWEFHPDELEGISDWYREHLKTADIPGAIRVAHFAINATFLLNPDNLPGFDHMRFIDMVALRQPKRLIVLNGPNHGLFDYSLNGAPAKGHQGIANYVNNPTQLDALLDHLAELPANVETIVLGTMPLPSQIPNLMPQVDDEFNLPSRPSGQRYYDRYSAYIFSSKQACTNFTGADVKRFDQEVDGLCNTIATKGRVRDPRIKPFAIHHLADNIDSKHFPDRTLKVEEAHAAREIDTFYSNRALQFPPKEFALHPRKLIGGLASLDNHHPTTVGYQYFANEILKLLGCAAQVPLRDRDDPLLAQPPRGYFRIIRIWRRWGKHVLERDGLFDEVLQGTRRHEVIEDSEEEEAVDEVAEELGLDTPEKRRTVASCIALIRALAK